MTENTLLDEELTRIVDLLNQIKKLNQMIELHQKESDDAFMVSQYTDMKTRFLSELKALLTDYEIEVLIKNQAA